MTMNERVSALECELVRSRRRSRMLFALLAAVVVGFVFYGLSQRVSAQAEKADKKDVAEDVVVAHRFVVVDQDNKPRVDIGKNGDGFAFVLSDANGKSRLAMRTRDDGESVVMLLSSKGNPMATLQVRDGEPQFALVDSDGWGRLWFLLDKNGKPSFMLTNEKGAPGITASIGDGFPAIAFDSGKMKKDGVGAGMTIGFNHEQRPGIDLFDAGGVPRISQHLGKDYSPTIYLSDAKMKGRISMDIFEGRPSIAVLDENEKRRAVLGADTYELPGGAVKTYDESNVLMYDKDGKPRWRAP